MLPIIMGFFGKSANIPPDIVTNFKELNAAKRKLREIKAKNLQLRLLKLEVKRMKHLNESRLMERKEMNDTLTVVLGENAKLQYELDRMRKKQFDEKFVERPLRCETCTKLEQQKNFEKARETMTNEVLENLQSRTSEFLKISSDCLRKWENDGNEDESQVIRLRENTRKLENFKLKHDGTKNDGEKCEQTIDGDDVSENFSKTLEKFNKFKCKAIPPIDLTENLKRFEDIISKCNAQKLDVTSKIHEDVEAEPIAEEEIDAAEGDHNKNDEQNESQPQSGNEEIQRQSPDLDQSDNSDAMETHQRDQDESSDDHSEKDLLNGKEDGISPSLSPPKGTISKAGQSEMRDLIAEMKKKKVNLKSKTKFFESDAQKNIVNENSVRKRKVNVQKQMRNYERTDPACYPHEDFKRKKICNGLDDSNFKTPVVPLNKKKLNKHEHRIGKVKEEFHNVHCETSLNKIRSKKNSPEAERKSLEHPVKPSRLEDKKKSSEKEMKLCDGPIAPPTKECLEWKEVKRSKDKKKTHNGYGNQKQLPKQGLKLPKHVHFDLHPNLKEFTQMANMKRHFDTPTLSPKGHPGSMEPAGVRCRDKVKQNINVRNKRDRSATPSSCNSFESLRKDAEKKVINAEQIKNEFETSKISPNYGYISHTYDILEQKTDKNLKNHHKSKKPNKITSPIIKKKIETVTSMNGGINYSKSKKDNFDYDASFEQMLNSILNEDAPTPSGSNLPETNSDLFSQSLNFCNNLLFSDSDGEVKQLDTF